MCGPPLYHTQPTASSTNAINSYSPFFSVQRLLAFARSFHTFSCMFFFLWYGRSRSKARSLHENKLSSIKLQHGHRWSHANWQIIKTKKQNTPPKRQDADPPARFASHLPKDSEANSERLSQVLVHEPVFNARAGTLIRQQ